MRRSRKRSCRWLVIGAAVCVISIGSFSASAQTWSLDVITLPGGATSVFREGDQTIVQTRTGVFYRLVERRGRSITADRLGSYRRAQGQRRPDMLPDGAVSAGSGTIAEAYFVRPTSRYRHGVLGDSIEALGLRIKTRDGKTLERDAGDEAVFEDIAPRLVDVDGDGDEELIAVRSFGASGASAVVFAVREGDLVELAAAEPIGRSNRWLNPVGVADFDGDGRLEIAVVRTPHIGGILILYEIAGGELVEEHRSRGYSNHFIGSRDLGLSAIADFDGDGTQDIAVPSADRGALRLVSFAGGSFSEIATIPLPARVRTDIMALSQDSQGLVVGLADGTLATIRRR